MPWDVLTDEQRELRDLVRTLARERIAPRAAEIDASHEFPWDVVELSRGRSNREIGQALHISEHTAANHIRSILRKTSCANRTEAAGYALRRGLVPD